VVAGEKKETSPESPYTSMFTSVSSFVGIVLLTILVGFLINYIFADFFASPCPHCAAKTKELETAKKRQAEVVNQMSEDEVLQQLLD